MISSLSNRFVLCCLVFSLVAALTGCEMGEPGIAKPADPALWDTVGLTYDVNNGVAGGRDFFTIAGGHDLTIVSAGAGNVGGNTRIAFGYVGANGSGGDGGGGEVCSTWAGESQARAQEGVLLGWDNASHMGVTFTKNIWAGATWQINLHEWRGGSFTPVQSWDVPVLHSISMPYHFCARRDGADVRFRVWGMGAPDPGYFDPSSSGYAHVSFAGGGLYGWYAGHLEPGHSLAYRSLDVAVW